VHSEPNIRIRYYAHQRFHAKIYLFDAAAMLGSSNLTDGGLQANREATIVLEDTDDPDAIVELRGVFKELWDFAAVLTDDVLKRFTDARKHVKGSAADEVIAGKVGIVEPRNINIQSQRQTAERMFLETLRRQVADYRNAFNEVAKLLDDNRLYRPECDGIASAHQANRFLSWVRRKHAPGEAWQATPYRPQKDRSDEILRLAAEWIVPSSDTIQHYYIPSLHAVEQTFGSTEAIQNAAKEELTTGLTSLHAFYEQQRFVTGGASNLPIAFWQRNNDDIDHVRETLMYWVHGGGDFVERLHDVLFDGALKLKLFGTSCALELYGTVKPKEYPPINGRIIKGLRYLGFDVRGA
jgi:hypothetical protein